jgi:hypothetical protein
MQTTLSVSLKGAPLNANEGSIPNGVSILDAALDNNAPAQTGLMLRDVASPGAFTALEGPGVTVGEVTLLVLRSSSSVEVELTQSGGAAEIVKVKRLLIVEFDSAAPLVLLRVKGTAMLEYFASGLR